MNFNVSVLAIKQASSAAFADVAFEKNCAKSINRIVVISSENRSCFLRMTFMAFAMAQLVQLPVLVVLLLFIVQSE